MLTLNVVSLVAKDDHTRFEFNQMVTARTAITKCA